jgi:hypothetical protein
MANTFKLKRSAVQGRVPTTGDLQLGELALNTYDGKLYTKKDNGTASIVEIGAGGGGGGFAGVYAEFDPSITTNTTFSATKNILSVGPLTLASGVSVTVPASSNWVIV